MRYDINNDNKRNRLRYLWQMYSRYVYPVRIDGPPDFGLSVGRSAHRVRWLDKQIRLAVREQRLLPVRTNIDAGGTEVKPKDFGLGSRRVYFPVTWQRGNLEIKKNREIKKGEKVPKPAKPRSSGRVSITVGVNCVGDRRFRWNGSDGQGTSQLKT